MKGKGKLVVLLALLVVLVGINVARQSPPARIGPAGSALTAGPADRPAGPSPSLAVPDAVLAVAERGPSGHVRTVALGRNIFQYGASRPRPPAIRAQVAPAPPPAAPPPPAPLRFFGFAHSSQSGKRQVFLTDGDEVYVAAEGDLILRRYRLLRVGTDSVEVEEVAGPHRWVLPLEQP